MAIKIGLDPGHGGAYTGTYSCTTAKDGLYEKHYTLELCEMVADRLLAQGFEVVMTRSGEQQLDINKRADIFIKERVNYGVSIHFNGMDYAAPHGCEVFVPYAEKGAGIEAGYQKYLGEIFTPRQPFAKSNNADNRNNVFNKKLNLSTRKFDAYTPVYKDYFGIIRRCWAAGISCDLLEVCFLTNPDDLNFYINNKEKVADAIARSITEGYRKVYDYKATDYPLDEFRYFVGTGWENSHCVGQVGAFLDLENAKECLNGYKVFDSEGNTVFPNI